MAALTESPVRRRLAGRWIDHWDPDEPGFWAEHGRRIANRNLLYSICCEHVGFSVWSLWSVLVLFLGPAYGLSVADKFLITAVPTVVGAVLRIPYTLAVARFGGRNWTVVSAAMLLVPCALAAPVLHPGTSLGTFLVVAAVTGLGGGNFASSMTNINTFYPESRKGWALGLNAGGGNLGVAGVQLVSLLVLGTTGAGHPRLVLWVYLPLIVLTAVAAALRMDNLSSASDDTRAVREVVRNAHCWVMSLLYVGTFGSFIGYGFAFGLVLQGQFHRSPVQAAAVTFLGPLLGSLARPLGGLLADRIGGALVTLADFTAMAGCAGVLVVAGETRSLGWYTVAFVALFVFSGIGNGSTYKMIPVVFRERRLSGAVIGVAGALGALGGVGIDLAFRQSFAATGSGTPAVVGFLVYYGICAGLTWLVRRPGRPLTSG